MREVCVNVCHLLGVRVGGTEETKSSEAAPVAAAPREASDGDVIDRSDMWGKHHPLQHLEGAPLQAQLHTRFAFQQLYALLTPMIKGAWRAVPIPFLFCAECVWCCMLCLWFPGG